MACWCLKTTFPSRVLTGTDVVGCCCAARLKHKYVYVYLPAHIQASMYVCTYTMPDTAFVFSGIFDYAIFCVLKTSCILYVVKYKQWLYHEKIRTTTFVAQFYRLEGHTPWHMYLHSVLLKIIVLFFPFSHLPIRIVPLGVRFEWCSIIIHHNKRKTIR